MASSSSPLISPQAFVNHHLTHVLSHPPDNLLFPFLHGLEGDNNAQNMFFASAPHHQHNHSNSTPAVKKARPPKYRGLVWVVCEEDLDAATLKVLRRKPAADEEGSDYEYDDHAAAHASSSSEDDMDDDEELDEDDTNSSFLGEDPADAAMMDVDVVSVAGENDKDGGTICEISLLANEETPKDKLDPNAATHMHPVHHRATTTTTAIPISQSQSPPSPSPPPSLHFPIPTSFSSHSSSTSTSTSASEEGTGLFSFSPITETDVEVESPASSFAEVPLSIGEDNNNNAAINSESTSKPQHAKKPSASHTKPHQHQLQDPLAPPLLTSTFRPRELLRKRVSNPYPILSKPPNLSIVTSPSEAPVPAATTTTTATSTSDDDDDEWEFVPARVPDGISLRNFGIQVPIYATLSDIVVYSPKGPTPAVFALARRFRAAVKRKREERMRNAGVGVAMGMGGSGVASEEGEGEEEFLRYNVFVLDADVDVMRREMPHLMMRICGEGVPGVGGAGGGGGGTHRHQHRKVAQVDEQQQQQQQQAWGAHTDGPDGHLIEQVGMDVDADVDREDVEGEDEDEDDLHTFPNTVDFAQREKEEMRDLTKASEIISVFPIGLLHPPPPAATAASTSRSAGSSLPSSPTLPSHVHLIDTTTGGGGARGGGGGVNSHTHTPPGVHPHVHPDPAVDLSTTKTHWDPAVGQVFLGNSNDVPLSPVVPGVFRHAVTIPPRDDDDEEGEERLHDDNPFNFAGTNDPKNGYGYDICIECHDLAPFPSSAHLRAAEEHLAMLDVMWAEKWEKGRERRRRWREMRRGEVGVGEESDAEMEMRMPPRPPPHANTVIHLPFPSSPSNSQPTMMALMPILRFLEKWLKPVAVPSAPTSPPPPQPQPPSPAAVTCSTPPPPSSFSPPDHAGAGGGARRWSSVSSMMPSFAPFPLSTSVDTAPSIPLPARTRSFTSPPPPPPIATAPPPPPPLPQRTRPLKVLIYSSDGYTESSVLALCLLMAVRGLTLPEAYLELQVAKRRSFFVYQGDLGILRRVEGRLKEERERERVREMERERERERLNWSLSSGGGGGLNGNGKRVGAARVAAAGAGGGYGSSSSFTSQLQLQSSSTTARASTTTGGNSQHQGQIKGRPTAKSVSFAQAPQIVSPPSVQSPPMVVRSHHNNMVFGNTMSQEPATVPVPQPQHESRFASAVQPGAVVKGRPRASTSPWLPSLFGGDHQSWFNDPRFDGSFPSRVLPFLYLGNLNHASNVYMLHALGITHVVSVGECALVPPPHHLSGYGGGGGMSGPASAVACHRPGPGPHFIAGKGPGGQGSLWIEEREGRIKVLDIKGVCDDGIDTLEPQLEPICDWIDKARQEGGQVLVHCRVGVSRSATVTIAYVMKHLGLPLVDAYLIVRSRRLSVLIQPNMRLLYNLCGWEIQLAKERAGNNEKKLKKELARTLSWPYLAKEVHALNEKYLH